MGTPSTSGSFSPNVPTATYRLQFGPGFGFRDATEIVPYLDALGVSHVYASPILKARRGSTHGYDITDHNALNDELGDERELDDFVAALHRYDMGLILDFIPNHMGIGQADNAWWLDVLEWGQASPYAGYFDIDWRPEKRELRGKVLLPFLGDHYGAILEASELQLGFDADAGTFGIRYHDHRFPIAPHLYSRILAVGLDETRRRNAEGLAVLEALIIEFRGLRSARTPASGQLAARAAADGLKRQLVEVYDRDEHIGDHVGRCLDHFNGVAGEARSHMPLHRLLEQQHYRLAYWRVAADEINYRRFFDINELAALKMENRELFDTVHRRVLRWIADGMVQGLRFDHVDGLFNPRAYCRAVQDQVATLNLEGKNPAPPFYMLVEKILAGHEKLRGDWSVAGTTGYEFANQLNGVFVDTTAERAMDRTYRRFAGEDRNFDDLVRDSKLRIMNTALSGELTVLARELDRIAESNWRSRDFTLERLREALCRVVAEFSVYRTYVEDRQVLPDDRDEISRALAAARARNPDIDTGLLDFLGNVLTTDLVRRPNSGYRRRQVVRFVMMFQQYTGPVMAKSVEDTAMYRYHRLASLNEVGGEPSVFGSSVEEFHQSNLERLRSFPHSMLATTTHDTKRSEDVRARIDVLSEIPDEWERQVDLWRRLNRRIKSQVDGRTVPTANDEYLLYQTLVGAWPTESNGALSAPYAELGAFRGRIAAYMVKAVREAKTQSSWNNPDLAYENAMTEFISDLLGESGSSEFLDAFLPFQAFAAWFGMLNGISQTALKLLSPGVPDIYQGAESWCLSLVDPDNRRPVAFANLADELARPKASEDRIAPMTESLLDSWQDGRVKLWLTRTLLRLRRDNPHLFHDGSYIPGEAAGAHSDHVCAFARRQGRTAVVAVVPRLMARLIQTSGKLPVGEAVWRDTSISLPWSDGATDFVDVVTGRSHVLVAENGKLCLPLAAMLRDYPVSVIVTA